MVKNIQNYTCFASSETELLRHFSPSESIFCLYLNLENETFYSIYVRKNSTVHLPDSRHPCRVEIKWILLYFWIVLELCVVVQEWQHLSKRNFVLVDVLPVKMRILNLRFYFVPWVNIWYSCMYIILKFGQTEFEKDIQNNHSLFISSSRNVFCEEWLFCKPLYLIHLRNSKVGHTKNVSLVLGKLVSLSGLFCITNDIAQC